MPQSTHEDLGDTPTMSTLQQQPCLTPQADNLSIHLSPYASLNLTQSHLPDLTNLSFPPFRRFREEGERVCLIQ
jgi:hypothetical protein